MHTTTFEIKDHGYAIVHHNGDWSGDAIVCWNDGGDPDKQRRVELPASILIAVCKESASAALRSAVIECVENWKNK